MFHTGKLCHTEENLQGFYFKVFFLLSIFVLSWILFRACYISNSLMPGVVCTQKGKLDKQRKPSRGELQAEKILSSHYHPRFV